MLSDEKINKLFDDEFEMWVRANPSYEVLRSKRDTIIDLFKQLQKERKYKNIHIEEYANLMGAIAERVKVGMSPLDIKEDIADVMGMSYYDNFLGRGEKTKILSALKEHGIPIDVLSVVTKEIASREWNIPNGKIIQHIESDNGRSPHIVYFAIIVNNEVIYEFGKQRYDTYKKDDDQSWFSFYEDTLPQRTDAIGRRTTKSVYAGTVVSSDGKVYTRWVNSNDRFYTRRVK